MLRRAKFFAIKETFNPNDPPTEKVGEKIAELIELGWTIVGTANDGQGTAYVWLAKDKPFIKNRL